jgi:hypothetical protein
MAKTAAKKYPLYGNRFPSGVAGLRSMLFLPG